MAKDKKGSAAGKFAIGALLGAAVGTVAGILTAPKSGKETREDIKRKAGEVKETAAEKAKDVKKLADKKAEEAKNFLKKKKNDVAEAVDEEIDE